jgi:hypothetical protein
MRGLALCVSLLAFILALVSVPAEAAADADATYLATPLLVVSFVLCVCILVVSGFTLWQSHRYYLDTVRLSREITSTTTELHGKVIELIYSLKDFLAHESELVKTRGHRTTKSQTQETSGRISRIVDSISETENKIKALEKTLGRLNDQLSFNFSATDVSRKISALGDIEYAVLFKLLQDPNFFEKNSFSSFGATPKVLDSLLSRQLVVFDKDGKAKVPKEVAIALRQSEPKN